MLRQGIKGMSDLITLPGLINLDFADVRTIMAEAGNALLGIDRGRGEKRALDSAEQAVSSPLLETTLEGAKGILLSISGGGDLSLWEVNEAAKAVQEAAHPEANIIFGAMLDDKLEDEVWVTVVATGYGDEPAAHERQRLGFRQAGEGRGERGFRQGGERGERRGSERDFREPAGEPRVRRGADGPRTNRGTDVEVPEFIPRF